MSTSEIRALYKSDKNTLLSVNLALLKLLLLAAVSILLTRPVGSVAGHIALEQQRLGLYSYNMRENKVYAVVEGPRVSEAVERGAWVKPDGSFRIDQLPVGEYSLKVHAQGYSTVYETGIFVENGKVTEFPETITMSVLEPGVSVASNTRVFTTVEKPHFWVNASGGTHLKVKIYAREFLSLLSGKHGWSDDDLNVSQDLHIYKADDEVLDFVESGQPVKSMSREVTLDDEDSARADFRLSEPLPPGDYFAVATLANAEGETDRSLTWFTVTDVGLVIKQARNTTLVRAVDLKTLKPRQGVMVSAMTNTNNAIEPTGISGKTGADGTVELPALSRLANATLLVCGSLGNQHAFGEITTASSDHDQYQTYFYTDRPVYRLGQAVYFKALARMLSPDGYRTPEAGTEVSVTAEDPDNNKIWSGALRTNNHGTFHGLVEIPSEGKTGLYQLTFVYPDGSKDYERFEVAQYRKPEYQVEVTPVEPRVVAGSKVRMRVRASYYFGAPVRDARIKYSVYASTDWSSRYKLMPRPAYYSYFDDWEDEEAGAGYYDSYSGGDYVSQGFAQTDDAGEAIIEFDSQPIEPDRSQPFGSQYLDKSYKVEAEVTDISRMTVLSSGYCSVTAGNFALFVQPHQFVCRAGDPIAVDFTAVGYDRKPVANQAVVIKLVRWLYDRVEHTYRGQELEEQYQVVTGSDGQGRVSFRTKGALPTDTYVVTAEAIDSQNHLVYDESSVWIANASIPYMLSADESQRQALQVKLDKGAYRPGETARVMISGPFTGSEGADALVTVEGPKLYRRQIVPMTATAAMVEIPVESAYEPNVYVTVAIVGPGHQFYEQSKIMKVAPQEHFLNVTVDTDKTRYRPGDKVTYTIHASYPNGKPAPDTELSLGVVDKSIYAIRPEQAQDIQKFFYSRRYNDVSTICSFPEQYSGGPDKIEPKVRKDFRDTAAWLPEVTTNADGIAIASITLPDNLTTWRATVRGINTSVDVGQATNKIVSTQEMILRLALPRFFTEGDQGLITAVVHNYTGKPQSVRVTLAASGQFQLHQAPVQERQIAPDKAERYQWPVTAVSSGEATIAARAIGQTAGDAMERKLPVRSLGLPAFSARSGCLRGDPDQVTLPVGLSRDAAPETARYQLSVAPSSIGPVLGNFDTLIKYPYGCTEQTMSRLMPSVVAMRLHQQLAVPIDPASRQLFADVYKRSLEKLKHYQHDDGGWGWWEYDQSSVYLTAHVLEGLYLLRSAGYEVDSHPVRRALDWLSRSLPALHKQLTDPQIMHDHYADLEVKVDMAEALDAMSLYGQKPPAPLRAWLIKETDGLTPEALSFLTMAYKRWGDDQAAGRFFHRLVQMANVHENLVDWDHSETMLKLLSANPRSKSSVLDYTYRFTGVETTALALRAVLAMEPENHERIDNIKEWLLLQRDRDGWANTKTTSQVFVALLEEELADRAKTPAAFSLAAYLADAALATLNFDLKNEYGPETRISVPVTATPRQLTLKKAGPGRLYYNSLVTYMRHLKPGDEIAEKSLPRGIGLSRQFFRLQPGPMNDKGQVHFTSRLISDRTIKAGETVLMKVQLETPVALPYVIVEAALPSGAEVASEDPRASMVEGGQNESESFMIGDWGEWWWTHQDVLDDRIVFFVTNLPAGKHEFYTMVRMEMPGTFQINPMSLTGMYTNKVRAYSGLDYLKVVE